MMTLLWLKLTDGHHWFVSTPGNHINPGNGKSSFWSWHHATGSLFIVEFVLRFHLMVRSPAYVMNLIHLHSASRYLKSSDKALLNVPRSRLKQKGDRALRPWNQLLLSTASKSRLKTHLHSLAFLSV